MGEHAWRKKYKEHSRGIKREGTSKDISGEMSGLINLHILRSECILIKAIVRMTTRTLSSIAHSGALHISIKAAAPLVTGPIRGGELLVIVPLLLQPQMVLA